MPVRIAGDGKEDARLTSGPAIRAPTIVQWLAAGVADAAVDNVALRRPISAVALVVFDLEVIGGRWNAPKSPAANQCS